MATTVDRLILRIEADTNNALKSIDNFTKRVNNASRRIELFNRMQSAGFQNTAKLTKANAVRLAQYESKIKKTQQTMQRMNQTLMQFGLSALFTGMAIKNFAQGIARNLTNTFMQLADGTNMGVRRILSLQAAVGFLKFVLFDTFARTELFGKFVEFVVTAVDKISEFAQQHPGLVKVFAILGGITVVLSAIFMVIGQVALGILGVIALVGEISLAKFFSISMLWNPVVLVLMAIAALVLLALNHLKNQPEHIVLITEAVGNLMGAFIKVWSVIQAVGKAIGVTLPSASRFAFGIVVGVINFLAEQLTSVVDMITNIAGGLKALIGLRFGEAAGKFGAALTAGLNVGVSGISLGRNIHGAFSDMKGIDNSTAKEDTTNQELENQSMQISLSEEIATSTKQMVEELKRIDVGKLVGSPDL